MTEAILDQVKINSVLKLFSDGQLQTALDLIDTFLEDYPNESILFNIQGACHAELGSFEIAVKSYEQAILINSGYAKAYFNLAGTLHEMQDLDASVERYKQSLKIEPENEAALNNLGNVYIDLDDHSNAIECYRKALEIKPDYVEALYSQGSSFYTLGQLQEAIKSYEKLLIIRPSIAGVRNNLGNIYRELGDTDSAIASYENAIKINPDFYDAHKNLGNLYDELNQYDLAVNSYLKAILIKPNSAEVYFNLGLVFDKLEQFNDAVKYFGKASILESNNHDLFNSFGITLTKLERYDEALECYQKGININPVSSEINNNIGITFKELKRFDEALVYFKKALTLQDNFPEAYNNIGMVFKEQMKYQLAIENFKIAIKLNPKYYQAFNNLGLAMMDYGYLDEAKKYFKKALSIEPKYSLTYNNLGLLFKELGNKDYAINYFEQAIQNNNNYAAAYSNLSLLKKFEKADVQISQMQKLLNSNEINEKDSIAINFALSKAYEDSEDMKKQFKFLFKGNQLCKTFINFSIKSDINEFMKVKRLFKSGLAPKIPLFESSFHRPIFILGMPRSGTSLVEQIIASHNEVAGMGELETIFQAINPVLKSKQDNLYKLNEQDLFNIREYYLNYVSNLNLSAKFITDKMPANHRYIGFILSAFPEAKIVHLKRDARATCWSIYKRFFVELGNGYSYDQKDLAQYYALYSDLMSFWHKQFPNQIYDICYEDLTTNQEEETRKLLEYCDLDWDESCLNFHSNKRAVKTASALQVRKKMYQGSSEAWKKYEAYLQPLIKGLESF